MLVLLLPMVPS